MAWVSAGQKREEEMGESMESGPPEWEEGVYRLDGFTLMSVPEGSEGERVRVEGLGLAGQGRARAPQTFFFERTSLRQSVVFATVLERPLGISFEERGKRLVVADIAKGTDAWKKGEVAKLSPDRDPDAPMVGDVVRAVSSVNFFYGGQALFGMKPPARTNVLYGCDGKTFPEICSAMDRSQVSDGDFVLVLERDLY